MPLSTIFQLIYCESVLLVEETGVQIKKKLYFIFRDLLVEILKLIVDCIIFFFLIYIIIR